MKPDEVVGALNDVVRRLRAENDWRSGEQVADSPQRQVVAYALARAQADAAEGWRAYQALAEVLAAARALHGPSSASGPDGCGECGTPEPCLTAAVLSGESFDDPVPQTPVRWTKPALGAGVLMPAASPGVRATPVLPG